MRILHVHSGNIFGGVERILIALAGHKRFSAEFEHEFALCFKDRLAGELEKAGARVHALPEVRLSRPWQVARARGALWDLLRAGRYDLGIVHSIWAHCAFGPALKSAGAPLIFWLHSEAAGPILLEQWTRMHPPRFVIAVSHHVRKTAVRLFPKTKCEVIYAPLAADGEAFAAANRERTRAELGVAPEAVVILQASRLESWKGHRALIQALGKIRDDSRWACWIAGGAERAEEKTYLAELKGLAEKEGVSGRVRFLGRREDIPALLKAADIYCQPNLEPEGFSIAFVEAACAGLPIVTSEFATATELVGEGYETLLLPGDVSGLAEILQRLANDAGYRERLGLIVRKRALELCDPARQFRALEKLFREAVTNG